MNRILLIHAAALLLLSGCQPLVVKQESQEPPTPSQADTLGIAGSGEIMEQAREQARQELARLAEVCEEPKDLWHRLRAGFDLQDHNHPRIQSDIDWYERHPSYMERVVERATPYLHLIIEELERRDMPMEIALLPVVESAFQPFAYSHGRAAGLWQFIPGTGRRFGLNQTWWYDGRRDVAESTRAALDYLQYLHRHFDGDWLHALAAYNSGEGTVGRAIRRNRRLGKPTDYWSLDLPRETEGYVPKLLAVSTVVENPLRHGIVLESIADQPFLTAVEIGSQIDLDLAAELAELSLEEIYLYNPGFNRWATDPSGPHRLLVPLENAEQFARNLEQYPKNERIAWKRHRVQQGEVLGVLARNYGTTVSMIQSVNGIRGHNIRVGQTLTIPVARSSLERYSLSAGQRLESLQSRQRDGYKVEYRVRQGDTLWQIARKYEVKVQQLASWNGMAPRDPLTPGKKLVIWTREQGKVSAINPAQFVHPFEQNTTRRIGYTVRSGDSLARISQRFRVDIDSLKRWNKIDGHKYLQPGQHITLYVDVKRQYGQI
ncbi:MAG: LysM peptidoglycan-binding domain-containing protein [Gammaproteobacteria bacterium]|nr:LysM peptidoglycan-binding domain-containing protein [Gammaproteobacteria bacterium]